MNITIRGQKIKDEFKWSNAKLRQIGNSNKFINPDFLLNSKSQNKIVKTGNYRTVEYEKAEPIQNANSIIGLGVNHEDAVHHSNYNYQNQRITRVVKQHSLNKWVQKITKHLTSMENKSFQLSSQKIILNKYFIKTRNWSNPRFSQYNGTNRDLKQICEKISNFNTYKNNSYRINLKNVRLNSNYQQNDYDQYFLSHEGSNQSFHEENPDVKLKQRTRIISRQALNSTTDNMSKQDGDLENVNFIPPLIKVSTKVEKNVKVVDDKENLDSEILDNAPENRRLSPLRNVVLVNTRAKNENKTNDNENFEQDDIALENKRREVLAMTLQQEESHSDFVKCDSLMQSNFGDTLEDAKDMQVVHLKTIQIRRKNKNEHLKYDKRNLNTIETNSKHQRHNTPGKFCNIK